MTETIHNTVWQLFKGVTNHAKEHNSIITRTDDPKRLLIGWGCIESDSFHYVKLSSLKNRISLLLPFENEDMYKLIAESFRTQEGRNLITTVLNSAINSELRDSFERVLKLKVFW